MEKARSVIEVHDVGELMQHGTEDDFDGEKMLDGIAVAKTKEDGVAAVVCAQDTAVVGKEFA